MSSNPSHEISRLTAVVSGEVQGVGYRVFALRQARLLGLRGYARNLEDGSVEVTAEGPRVALDDLLAALRRGPISARVDDAVTRWSDPTGEFSAFSVR